MLTGTKAKIPDGTFDLTPNGSWITQVFSYFRMSLLVTIFYGLPMLNSLFDLSPPNWLSFSKFARVDKIRCIVFFSKALYYQI